MQRKRRTIPIIFHSMAPGTWRIYASVNCVVIGSDNSSASVLVAPMHYLNQCSRFINWNLGSKYQWNFNQNIIKFSQGNFKMQSAKCEPFRLSLNLLSAMPVPLFPTQNIWEYPHKNTLLKELYLFIDRIEFKIGCRLYSSWTTSEDSNVRHM